MKKLVALLLFCAIALAALTPAFAAVNDCAGLWFLSDMTVDGKNYSADTVGTYITLELLEGGAVNQVERFKEIAMNFGGEGNDLSFTLEDDVEQSTGTWKETGENEITVLIDDQEMVLSLVDGQLVLNDDDYDMCFGRKEPPEKWSEPAKAIPAELESFAGDWETGMVYIDGACLDAEMNDLDLYAEIEGTTVTLNGFLFDESVYEMQFQDGVMTYTAEDSEEELFSSIKIQLLESDELAIIFGEADPMTLTLVNSEEEEEYGEEEEFEEEEEQQE